MSVTRRALLATGAAVATTPIGLAAACSSNKPTPRTNPVEEVIYATGFLTLGRGGFVQVADAKGFFAQAGIKVRVVPGRGQPTDITALDTGKYHVMETETTQHTKFFQAGAATNTRIVAAIHQYTEIALMARTSAGIATPRDLAGKHIMYGAPAPFDLFPSYAHFAGISPDTSAWVKIDPNTLYPALQARRADAIGQFVPGLPTAITLVKAVHPDDNVVMFPYREQLSDLYGNAVAVWLPLLDRNPDLVGRFVAALLEGLKYSIEHPDQAGTIIHTAWPQTPAATAQSELEAMRDYVSINGSPVGALDPTKMAKAIGLLQSIGMVPGSVPVEDANGVNGLCDFRFAPKAA